MVAEPAVAGAAPILSPRKVNLTSFKSELGQLKAHNMQRSRPSAQLGSGEDQVKVAEK